MTDAKTGHDLGMEILQGIRQIKKGEVGRVVRFPSVGEIRGKTGLSRPEFAKLMGVSVRTLQEWERGRRAPSGPARALLAITCRHPQALLGIAV